MVLEPASLPILTGLGAVADRYDAYIVDLWGVLHDGVAAYPGAVACLAELSRTRKRVAILSNAPRRAADVARRTTEIGVPPDLYDGLVSSGEEAWRHLSSRSDPWYRALGRRAYCFMAGRDRSMLEGIDLVRVEDAGAADFLLALGVEGPGESVGDFEATLAAAARRGLPMVCANPDLEVVRAEIREICAGAIARRYEELGGTVRYHGKPYASVYERAFEIMGAPSPGRVLAIGDSLRTDIAGAAGVGIDSLLVTGGIHQEELGGTGGAAPDAQALAALCQRAGHHPTAAIGRLTW